MLCNILPALCFWCGQAFDSFLLKSACEDGSDRLEKYSTDLMSGDVEQQVMGEAVRTALNLAAEQSQAAETLRALAGPVCYRCAGHIAERQQLLQKKFASDQDPNQLVEFCHDYADLPMLYTACRWPWGLLDFIKSILEAGARANCVTACGRMGAPLFSRRWRPTALRCCAYC